MAHSGVQNFDPDFPSVGGFHLNFLDAQLRLEHVVVEVTPEPTAKLAWS